MISVTVLKKKVSTLMVMAAKIMTVTSDNVLSKTNNENVITIISIKPTAISIVILVTTTKATAVIIVIMQERVIIHKTVSYVITR